MSFTITLKKMHSAETNKSQGSVKQATEKDRWKPETIKNKINEIYSWGNH